MEKIELTNRLRKMISGLGVAKNRKAEHLFIAEGSRCVLEIMMRFRCRYLVATPEWIENHALSPDCGVDYLVAVSQSEMERMSQQRSPQPVMGVFEIPSNKLESDQYKQGLFIALDRVQDPGNLGTIIRLADWFGVSDIFCSTDTADVFNPKVVQATMGAITKVKLHYVDLPTFLKTLDMPIYGTFLDGDDIYETKLTETGVIVFGNEGNGISTGMEKIVDRRLLVPTYPPACDTVESLNVGVAAAIVVSEFRRRMR